MMRIHVRNGIVIAHDGAEHRLLEGGSVVLEGDRIVHVGPGYDGAAAETIDATGKLVIPGLISCHAHVGAQEGGRLLLDGGRRDFFRSGFLNYLPTTPGRPGFLAKQDARASLRYGFACLLRHGVTSVVPFAPCGAGMVETADEFGLRLFYAPLATGGRYVFDEAGVPRRHWDEKAGLAALDAAGEWIAHHRGGRVEGMVVLDEFHVSTPSLRRRAFDIAETLDVGFTLHFCEQVVEFQDCVRETGRTPVELLAEEGVLAPRTLLAHCLYVAGHRAVGYPYGNDRAILARSGASVAHSPAGLARRGVALETFQSFRDAGVRLALGTDTFPLDLFAEMRSASSVSKLIEQNHESADAMAVFEAATTGGADALRRPDLGRIASGAKADLVLVDFDNLDIGPFRDPIRMLVHVATSDMVDIVFIDGRKLVEGGRLLVCDEREVVAAARRSAEAVWAAFPDYHRAGSSVDDEFPPSIRRWGDN